MWFELCLLTGCFLSLSVGLQLYLFLLEDVLSHEVKCFDSVSGENSKECTCELP